MRFQTFGEIIFQPMAQMKRAEVGTGRIWDRGLYLVLSVLDFKFKDTQQILIYSALRWRNTFGFTLFLCFLYSQLLKKIKN